MQGRRRSSAGRDGPWGADWLACRHCAEPFPPPPRGRKASCSDKCRIQWHSTHRAVHVTDTDHRDRSMTMTAPRVTVTQLLQHVRELEAALAQSTVAGWRSRERSTASVTHSSTGNRLWTVTGGSERAACTSTHRSHASVIRARSSVESHAGYVRTGIVIAIVPGLILPQSQDTHAGPRWTTRQHDQNREQNEGLSGRPRKFLRK